MKKQPLWKNIFFNKDKELRVEDLMHIAITAMIIWIIQIGGKMP